MCHMMIISQQSRNDLCCGWLLPVASSLISRMSCHCVVPVFLSFSLCLSILLCVDNHGEANMLTMSLTTSLVITGVFTMLGHNDMGVNDKSHCRYPFLLSVYSNKWIAQVCVCVCVYVSLRECVCVCVHYCVVTMICIHIKHNLHNSPKF